MSTTDKMKNVMTLQGAMNKDAIINTALINGGMVLNKKVAQMVKPYTPIMVRGYLDTAIGEAIVGQLIAFAIMNFSNDQKAYTAAKAMIDASSFQLFQHFNIPEMLEKLLAGVNLPGAEAVAEVTAKKNRPVNVTAAQQV